MSPTVKNVAAQDGAAPAFSTRRVNVALLGLGSIILLLLAIGAHDQNRHRIITFTVSALALGVPYLGAAWVLWRARSARSTLWLGLGFAVAFRLVALFGTAPYLSTDVYRYIWDGRLQAAGFNPYRYIPADPALSHLRDAEIYPRINRRDYARTIYPPVAQAWYFLVTRFSESVNGMKVAMVFCEAVAVVALALLLRSHGLPVQRVLLYAWHPLPVWEFAGSGHVDAFMIALVLLALLAFRARRESLTGLALAAATLTKFFPVLLFPVLWRRRQWRMPVVFAVTLVTAYLPYYFSLDQPPTGGASADFLPGEARGGSVARPIESPLAWRARVLLGFLPGYAAEEGLNTGNRFYVASLLPSRPIPGLSRPNGGDVFKLLALASLATAAAWAVFRRPAADGLSYLRRSLALVAIFAVLLSPSYAWYFCWLIPFLVFVPSPPVFWMTTAAFVLYANWLHGKPHDVFLLNSLIFLPAAAWCFAWLAVRSWRRLHPPPTI